MAKERRLSSTDPRARGASSLAEAVEAEVRFPWIGVALLALLVAGFALMEWRAGQERDQIKNLTQAIYQQQQDAERRLSGALQGVASIVAAERTVTREIVRSEVQAGPTTTVTATKTARATVTETQTIIKPGPPVFDPAGCINIPGWYRLCRDQASAAGLIFGLPAFAFLAIRRSLR